METLWPLDPNAAYIRESPLYLTSKPDAAFRFSDAVNSFQDDIHSKLSDWLCGYTALLQVLAAEMAAWPAAAAAHLDIGSGKGAFAFTLAQQLLGAAGGLREVVGVDLCPAAVDVANRRYAARPPEAARARAHLEFRVIARRDETGRAPPLPFPPGRFTSASSCFVLSVLGRAEQRDLVASAFQCLAPGGTFAVLVNNPDAFGVRFTCVQVHHRDPRASDRAALALGQRVRASFFHRRAGASAGGGASPVAVAGAFFSCNDGWWPADHYVRLLRDGGFRDVRASAPAFSADLAAAAARYLGVPDAGALLPADAKERQIGPVLLVYGRRP